VSNYIQAPGIAAHPEEERVLQPRIGEEVIATDMPLGRVAAVVIDRRNRQVVSIMTRGQFPDAGSDSFDAFPGFPDFPLPERTVSIPVQAIKEVTRAAVWLRVNGAEAAEYPDFDPLSFRTPGAAWEPPFSYQREVVWLGTQTRWGARSGSTVDGAESAYDQDLKGVNHMRIAMHAVVNCSDGEAGRCSHVIVDPAALKVTHLVVGESGPPAKLPAPRLVVEESEHTVVLKTPHLAVEESGKPPLPRPPHLVVEEDERQVVLKTPHLVIEEDEPRQAEYLVPFDRVAGASADGIRLNCTRSALAAMDPFIERTYMRVNVPDYHSSGEAMWVGAPVLEETRLVPIDEERAPEHELAIDHRTRAEATDGEVGQVDELLVDPHNGRITHLLLCENHPWGPNDVVVPAAQIARLGAGAFYLKLDKKSVEALSAVEIG